VTDEPANRITYDASNMDGAFLVGPGQTVEIAKAPLLSIGGNGTPMVTLHRDGRLEYGKDYQPDEAARAFWEALQRLQQGMGLPSADVGRDDVQARLAEQLCRQYDFRGLDELEQEDPERAQEHRQAAQALLPWIAECPREERRAAFSRGYDKGRERQQARTAADMRRIEAELAELRQDRDPDGLRARIADLEYALAGWDRFMTGRIRAKAAPDWKEQAAEYLAKLTAVQRELAVLKGVQPSTATGGQPS